MHAHILLDFIANENIALIMTLGFKKKKKNNKIVKNFHFIIDEEVDRCFVLSSIVFNIFLECITVVMQYVCTSSIDGKRLINFLLGYLCTILSLHPISIVFFLSRECLYSLPLSDVELLSQGQAIKEKAHTRLACIFFFFSRNINKTSNE